MEVEYAASKVVCTRCGMGFSKRKGYFPVSYARLHKGIGYIPVCRTCIEQMYSTYLNQSGDVRLAIRQICRKLDLYYADNIVDHVEKKATSMSIMSRYMSRLTTTAYAGMSYDDTLMEENNSADPRQDKSGEMFKQTLAPEAEDTKDVSSEASETPTEPEPVEEPEPEEPVSEEDVQFWGTGYSSDMYKSLNQRWAYWMSKYPDDAELDIGTEVILKQICSLELDINRDRASGRPVDKYITTLNTLLGSLNMKPVQKKDDADASINNTPLGVWLYRFENEKPLPDTYKDSPILKYVFTWMGHLCKMLGVKGNKYTQLYEEEIRKNTVERPEYEGEDDLEEQYLEFLEETPSYNDIT